MHWFRLSRTIIEHNEISRLTSSTQLPLPIRRFVERTWIPSRIVLINGCRLYLNTGSPDKEHPLVGFLQHHLLHVKSASLKEEAMDHAPVLRDKLDFVLHEWLEVGVEFDGIDGGLGFSCVFLFDGGEES